MLDCLETITTKGAACAIFIPIKKDISPAQK
jgi:hypothetical protein